MSKPRQPIFLERNPLGTDARPGVTLTMTQKSVLLTHDEAAELEKALHDVRLSKVGSIEVSV